MMHALSIGFQWMQLENMACISSIRYWQGKCTFKEPDKAVHTHTQTPRVVANNISHSNLLQQSFTLLLCYNWVVVASFFEISSGNLQIRNSHSHEGLSKGWGILFPIFYEKMKACNTSLFIKYQPVWRYRFSFCLLASPQRGLCVIEKKTCQSTKYKASTRKTHTCMPIMWNVSSKMCNSTKKTTHIKR